MTLVRRVRLLFGAVLFGVVVGAGSLGLLVALGWPFDRVLEVVFGVGALALGFGLLGWSGSIMAGTGIEAMQEYLDTRSDWTERKSRRAMTRIGGFGTGLMLSSTVVELLAAGL